MSIITFLKQWVSSPIRTGAIAPSSKTLARQMTKDLELENARVVVELGAGTGVFSEELRQRMAGGGTLIMLERCEDLARQLQVKFPDAVVICDCATNLGKHLEAMGYKQVDYIVSGLPWTLFSPELQDRVLSQIKQYLKPGGTFVTFIYMHARIFFNFGIRFEKKLRRMLGRIDKGRPVLRNLPPARVWTWRRPTSLPLARATSEHLH